jgi:hypothetical protein
MAPPCWLPLLWLRVSHDSLAGRRCGELADRALHPIALTIRSHRAHLVVVGRLRLQTLHAHPENRLWVGAVEPDVTLRRLAQILGIRPVMHDAVMLVVAARVGGSPPDNRRVVVGNFELRRFGDLDMLGLLLRRKDLGVEWIGEEQAGGRSGDRQLQEQSIHWTDPELRSPQEEYAGRARPAYSCVRPMESGVVRAPAGHCKHPAHKGFE